MAHYFVTGIAIFIFILGFETIVLQALNGNMQESRFLTRRQTSEFPPTLNESDIDSLMKILQVVIRTVARQDAHAQLQDDTYRYQQMLASAYNGYMQGPSRYDEMMGNRNTEMQQQEENKFYDRLQGIARVAKGRPGSGGGGSFGGGR